jgi:hypothetical protein
MENNNNNISKMRRENVRIGSDKWTGNCKNIVWTKIGKRRINQQN